MNEKFTISLEVVVGSKNKQQLNNLTKQIKETSTSTTDTTKAIDKMNVSLNQLRNMSFTNVFSFISGKTTRTLNKMSDAIKDMVPNLRYTFKEMRKIGYSFKDSLFEGVKTGIPDLKQIKQGWKDIGSIIQKSCIPYIALFLKYLLLVKGITASIRNAIDVAAMGDSIKDEAQKVHLSTTAYQEWGYVLEQNGTTFNNLKMGMRTFSNYVATNNKVLKEYGITANTVDKAFEQAIFNIQNLSTETEKVAAMTALFGSRASELMPVLNMTNQQTVDLMMAYRALGGTMSDELVAMGDITTDNILAMKKAWQGLRNTLAYSIIPIVNKVVEWLTIAIGAINLFLKALLNIKETFSGKSSGDMGSGLADNLSSSAESAKEIKKTLASFDELNVLSSSTSSSGVDTGIEDMDWEQFNGEGLISGEVLEKLSKIGAFIDKYKAQIQTLIPILTIAAGLALIWFGHPLAGIALAGLGISLMANNWDTIVSTVKNSGSKVVQAVSGFISSVVGLLKEVWRYLKEVLFPVIQELYTVLKPVLDAVGIAVQGLITKVLIPLWTGLVGTLTEVIKTITGILSGLTTFIKGVFTGDWKMAWEGIKTIVSSAVSGVVNVASKIAETFKTVQTNIGGILSNILGKVGELITNILTKAGSIKGNMKTIISNLASAVIADVGSLCGKVIEKIKTLITNISTKVGTIKGKIKEHISKISSTVITDVGTICSKVLTKIKTLVSNITSKVGSIKSSVKTTISNISSSVLTGLSTLWKNMKSNVATGFKTVMNNVISLVESAVNRIANKFNSTGLLRGVNKILGTNISLPTISIPRLARGGVLTSPTVAMMGEYPGASNNPEIAAPQKLLTEIINSGNEELIDVMIQMGRQMISAIENQNMSVQIGDDVIARSASRGNQQYKNRTGKPLFGY